MNVFAPARFGLRQLRWNIGSNTKQSSSATSAVRSDIQALRGYAVLVVLIYHSNSAWLKAGYLGVDIFFVISGYVVTRLILDQIQSGSFSLIDFYMRRAKRLLPAAYVVFLLVAMVAPLFLNHAQIVDLREQLFGALLLAGNIVIWQQAGYFEAAAETKPLLHVWSLAIEEQYYLILPAALLIVPRRFQLPGTLWLVAASLAFCAYLMRSHPAAAFYLLPSRAWELSIGSLGAIASSASHNLTQNPLIRASVAPAIAALLVIPVAPTGESHPGLDAVIVCFATLVVLLAHSSRVEKSPLTHGLARIGNISYSLYLVHWPIICYMNIGWLGDVPNEAKAAGVAASLGIGYMLFAAVERPMRRANFSARAVTVGLLLGLFFVMGTTLTLRAHQIDRDLAFAKRPNHGLGPGCDFPGLFQPKEECRTSGAPALMVWGDSYAMHLVPGLVKAGAHLVQATRSGCGPLLALALFERVPHDGFNMEWARGCMAFNESVLEYLRSTPSIETVVLSSPFWHVGTPVYRFLERDSRGAESVHDGSVEHAKNALGRTIRAVQSLGRRVVVVAPPPSSGIDMGACAERLAAGQVALGYGARCDIPRRLYESKKAKKIEFLRKVERSFNVPVIWFDDFLCADAGCATFVDGVFVYRDAGHLSYEGSEFLVERMGLLQRLLSSGSAPQ